MEVELSHLTDLLSTLGCPKDKAAEMAVQLDKRARQLMSRKGTTYEQAMAHLLALLKQGWAAKERGL